MAKEKKAGCKLATAAVVFLILAIAGVLILSLAMGGGQDRGETMYVCGYDRCRDSGEYGQLIYATGINIWNGPEPNRGGVRYQASHGDRVRVLETRRVEAGPGGLWYRLSGGGWANDLWLTEQACSRPNLDQMSFSDCMGGTY